MYCSVVSHPLTAHLKPRADHSWFLSVEMLISFRVEWAEWSQICNRVSAVVGCATTRRVVRPKRPGLVRLPPKHWREQS